MGIRSDIRKKREEARRAAGPKDWRGEPVALGDVVVATYGWGGQRMAMLEGEIIQFLDDDYVRIDLHYDNGLYMRQRSWTTMPLTRCTKVAPR